MVDSQRWGDRWKCAQVGSGGATALGDLKRWADREHESPPEWSPPPSPAETVSDEEPNMPDPKALNLVKVEMLRQAGASTGA